MAFNVPVSNEDKQKSYYKYFLQEMAPGDPAKYEAIKKGPWDNQYAHTIDRRNELFLRREERVRLLDAGQRLRHDRQRHLHARHHG